MPATFNKKTKEAGYEFESTQVTLTETIELVHPESGRSIVRKADEQTYRSRGYMGLDEYEALNKPAPTPAATKPAPVAAKTA